MSGHITIPDEDAEISYVASASQTEFDIPFRFFATTDVQVAVDGVVQGSGYTVTGTAVDAGFTDGTLTFTTPLTGGETVLIYRDIPVERTSDFPYPSSTLEVRTLNTELDRIVAIIQDGQRSLGRALRVPNTEPSIDELPAAETRADGLLGFDADGNPTIVTIGDLGGIQGPQGEQGEPGRGIPIGGIMPWTSATLPAGFIWCDGSAVSRTTYADLYSIIGTTYGAGNGTTTFNLPDLRGRGIFGKDNMGGSAASRITSGVSGITGTTLGATGGDERLHQHTHAVTDPGHIHTGTVSSHLHTYVRRGAYNGVNQDFAAGTDGSEETQNTGSTQPTTTINSNTTGITIGNQGAGSSQNMPPAMILNWVICYAYVAASGGTAGGTVTSVAMDGGTTGLTFTGGPVVTAGTFTAGGTLAVANGGTGATSAANARTNLGLATLVLGFGWSGTVTEATQEVGRMPLRASITVPAGTYAFPASARVAATSSQTFTLYKDDGSSPASFGTAVFGAGSKTVTVTISSDTSFTALTHAITAVGAASPDATLADFTVPVPYRFA